LALPRIGRATLLDAEWLYRKALPAMAAGVADGLGRARDRLLARAAFARRRPGSTLVGRTLARSWPTGSMAFWTVVLLVILLFAGVWRG
jgi:multicomponent Na+:H+ antiporter subunit D